MKACGYVPMEYFVIVFRFENSLFVLTDSKCTVFQKLEMAALTTYYQEA